MLDSVLGFFVLFLKKGLTTAAAAASTPNEAAQQFGPRGDAGETGTDWKCWKMTATCARDSVIRDFVSYFR